MPEPGVSCESVFGRCYDILDATDDNENAMQYYPPKPDSLTEVYNDDIVNYHGSNMHKVKGKWYNYARIRKNIVLKAMPVMEFALVAGLVLCLAMYLVKKYKKKGEGGDGVFCVGKRGTYSKVADVETPDVTSHSLYGSDSDS